MAKKNYYAVRAGKQTGIYTTWEACKQQVDGYPSAQFKGFPDLSSAQEYLGYATTPLPVTSSSVKIIPTVFKKTVPEKKVPVLNRIQDEVNRAGSHRQVHSLSVGEKLNIYTDGSCLDNGKRNARAGVGVYFGPQDPRNISEPLTSPPMTNNRAEMMAVIRALEVTSPSTPKIIHSDSQYMRQGITLWIKKWRKNGWKTANHEPVKNEDLWRRLDQLVHSHVVEFKWVKGHAGHSGNEEADRLANEGALR